MTDDLTADPHGVDLSIASPARMYDYYLGGKDNFPADRAAADKVIAEHPQQRQLARNNRGFLARAVGHLAELGIDQFIDVGTGIPTSPNVHEIARGTHPEARVVYVDDDPVVLAHARALLQSDANVAVIDADMHRPDGILDDPRLGRLIDLRRPVGVLFVAVLHFAAPGEPSRIVGRFREVMAPGSCLVASVGSSEGLTAAEVDEVEAAYAATPRGGHLHGRAEIEDLFTGLDLVFPGVVDVSRWRGHDPATRVSILAGVGRSR